MVDTKQKKSLEPDWTNWFPDATWEPDEVFTPEQVAAMDAAVDGPTSAEEAEANKVMKPSDRVAAAKPPKPGDTQAAAKPDSRKKK